MAKVFRPIRGKEADLFRVMEQSGQDGDIYFAIDTGFIYILKDGQTYTLGGSGTGGGGSSFVWADAEEEKDLFEVLDDNGDPTSYYTMKVTAIENSTEENPKYPQNGLLVINSDGRFFRVTGKKASEGLVELYLIAVSGSGQGGGGGTVPTADLELVMGQELYQGAIFLYGQKKDLTMTASSTKDSLVRIYITAEDKTTGKIYEFPESGGGYQVTSGRVFKFDASLLPVSNDLTITIKVDSSNSTMRASQKPSRKIENVKIVQVGLEKYDPSAYLPLVKADDAAGVLKLEYIPYGDAAIEETLHVYVDNEEIDSKIIPANYFGAKDTVMIPRQTHGVHEISLNVSVNVGGETVFGDPIIFQGAWAGLGEEDPIIWIGNYDPLIINYENSYIRYMVYDPVQEKNGLAATVYKYKDSIKIMESEETYSGDHWLLWDITNSYTVGSQTFSIACKNTKVDIPIEVTTEGSRDLGIAQAVTMSVNMTAAGRSNSEVKSSRGVWKSTIVETDGSQKEATLAGFNWQNNGWRNDGTVNGVDNGTYLSLTNGATVSIPADSMYLNYDTDFSIEMRFRVRNVQEYSTLVQSLPLYYYKTDDGKQSEKGALMSWINENHKELVYDQYGSPLMDEENVEKSYKTEEGVICKWMNDNNQGLVIGSQEAYFRSPRGIISVRYKEDEVINISCVISKTDGLVYIYLNGILSGADSLPSQGGAFRINSPFLFNSNYCDIDLYRFRIFRTGLTMPEVIHNYLSDMHSITLYDQNQLTDDRTPTALEYNMLVDYNANHPGAQTMPYAVWTIKSASRDEKLPYFKGDGVKVDIDFINPCLDEALENGDIDEWFYYTHCPSFHAEDVDIDVQGTSSQGYPRRNYKTKYKKATSWVYTKGSLAGESLTAAHEVKDAAGVTHTLAKSFHMDNKTVGTNKFTWKIDYMESSGSYNTGFANLLGNLQYPLYTKHPLNDLNIDATDLRTTVYGFPILTFHKYANASFNPTNPGATYEYIGRYNMNLDKSSNEYYGFESSEKQPFITLEDGSHPKIKDIAECWELRDNQGTWCSFKYPNAAARATRFGTPWPDNPNRLEVMRHFEYRYSPFADQLDAIGADGKYDGTTSDTAIIAEIGTTDAKKSEYVRAKYANLESLFDWLDSTDTAAATGNNITPVTWETEKAYGEDEGEVSDGVLTYNLVAEGTAFDENETYYTFDGTGYVEATGLTEFANGVSYYIHSIGYYNTTFSKDTAGYRLEKFRNEFNEHLDKEYCLIYFILTELLLCYDSRGKNMMLASFGPHRDGGDYVWYPIFYDIDTQLGLNNSGAYLWDYDADVTLDGLFSTPSSVLWLNFYAAFETDIKNKYRALRGANDGSTVVNNLTYEKITGAYECNPEVFGSYAMRGIRPVIAIGLDEYYKYFATTKTGYFDTEGKTIVEDTPEYAYACQGDKKLTTELLLRNRLNYIDSWWLGGDYYITKVKQGQFWGRVNGNRGDKTSDKYLDLPDSVLASDTTKYGSFVSGTYPVPYYDSQPGFKLKPFLKQYVTYFTDEVPGAPVKYNATAEEANGVWTSVNDDTIATYKTDPESPNEQLVYLPGVDYLSSLGDLSTSYFSEFTLTAGKRLLDLTLGSDIPNYKNDLLKAGDGGKFTIADGLNSTTKKSLLKKIIFTGITSLRGTVDTQGSEKLEEFRALRTSLQNVYFADGAPLHTVHLPDKIESLRLVANADLTRILTTRPVVCTLENGVATYTDPATYRGLYLEGITDFQNENAGSGSDFASLTIEGGGLGYGSYTILQNLVKIKTGAPAGKNGLVVTLKDVKWSPYVQVEEGESYVSGVQYYRLTDHSTFVEYTYTTATDWNYQLLNGKIYTYNSNYNRDPENGAIDEQTITSLQLLDDFASAYDVAKANGNETQFQNNTEACSVPAITGELYVANTELTPIAEDKFSSKYKKYWPNLKIYAAYVIESYIAKFVQINESGREEELLLDKLAPDEYTQPVLYPDLIPQKAYHDFKGWALDTEGRKMVATYDGISFTNRFNDYASEMTFDPTDNSVITLYAIFTPHEYEMSFDCGDGSDPVIVKTAWSTGVGLNEPTMLPSKPYPYADMETTPNGDLGLYRTYKFIGWAFTSSPETVVNLATIKADRDRQFVAVYEDVDIHDNVLDEKYFALIGSNSLTLNREYTLTGKICIPATVGGVAYTSISDLHAYEDGKPSATNAITHIFFEDSPDIAVVQILENACQSMPELRYFEMPATVEVIGGSAFSNCPNFGITDDSEGSQIKQMFDKGVVRIGSNIFSNSYNSETQNGVRVLNLGSKDHYISDQAFAGMRALEKVIIGSPTLLSQQTAANIVNGNAFGGNNGVTGSYNTVKGVPGTIIIYSAIANDLARQDVLGYTRYFTDIQTITTVQTA